MPHTSKLPQTDYKTRLENKLYLARVTPEPEFDLSDCNLTNVPNNIYSLCKVLRKEAFYLQKNQLTSLSNGGDLVDLQNLILLDINTNNFSKLPENIDALKNLKVFNVSKNRLTDLPKSIGNLQKLVVLNVSHNKLKYLPDTLGNCKSMEILNVSNNEPLKELPKTFGRLRNLVELNLDPTITYPPPEICKGGVTAVLRFFETEFKDISGPSTSKKSEKLSEALSTMASTNDVIQDHIRRQEEIKQGKQKERLEFEKALAKQKQEEIKLQERSKEQKNKVLVDIKDKEKLLNAELSKLQVKKNQQRASLIKLIQEEEIQSNEIVNKILQLKKTQRLSDSLLLELERKDEEKYLLSHAKSTKPFALEKALAEMEALMQEDIRKAQTALAQKREKTLNSLTSEIILQQEELYSFMKKRDVGSAQLLEAIRQNENLQKVAVTSLLEKSDAASWELTKKILIVETQLAELTKIELKKRKLKADNQITQLSENRLALTRLLVNLFEKQAARRKVLIAVMENMERLKESYRDSSTFWMEQYNRLFDSKAHEMVKFLESVDQDLVFELFINEVFQYLPLLKDVALDEKALENLNVNALLQLGIKDRNDCNKILHAVESFLTHKNSEKAKPSAPLLVKPSAPEEGALYSAFEECVICFDKKPEVVFLPCGHVCCCFRCFASIALCPLCRRPIDEIHELLGLSRNNS